MRRASNNSLSLHLQKDKENGKRDNRYVRGSSLGMCSRQIGYMTLGYAAAPNFSHSLFTMDLGNAIHDMVQHTLVKMGWIKAERFLTPDGAIDWRQTDDPLSGCELPIIDHDLRIIGHCDGVTVPLKEVVGLDGLPDFVPDPNGERMLIEIKSITNKSFFWVRGIMDGGAGPIKDENSDFIRIDPELTKSSGNKGYRLDDFSHVRDVIQYGRKVKKPVYKLMVEGEKKLVTVLQAGCSLGAFSSLEKPDEKHVMQASFYAKHFGLSRILFLYVGKDIDSREFEDEGLLGMPIKIFEVDVTDRTVAIITDKVKKIYEYVDRGELPPREYGFEDKKSPCPYCRFNHLCYPQFSDMQDINSEIQRLGLRPLDTEKGAMHSFSGDLTDEYSDGKAVI